MFNANTPPHTTPWLIPSPATGPTRPARRPYVPSNKWVRETHRSANPTSNPHHSPEPVVEKQTQEPRLMIWSLDADEQTPAAAMDRFLAAQELGLQHELDLLIFKDIPADQLVSFVCAVREPYQCISVNTEYERTCKPHASASVAGYLVLYDVRRWKVSRWPEFYKPSLFYAGGAYLRPPLVVGLSPLQPHLKPLSLYVWKVERSRIFSPKEQIELLINSLPLGLQSQTSLVTLTMGPHPEQSEHPALGVDEMPRAGSWVNGAKLSPVELPGVQALSNTRGERPSVLSLSSYDA